MDTVVAGALGALTVDILILPLDTIKTRLQAPDCKQRFPTRRALFTGLYRGVGSVVIATLPAAGTFFTTYEGSKTALAGYMSGPALHMTSSAIAELASCVILTPAEIIKQRAQVASDSYVGSGKPFQTAVETTIDRAKHGDVKQAVQSGASEGMKQSTAHNVAKNLTSQTNYTRTFVRGYMALAGRNLPFTAMQFPLYEKFREVLSRRWNVQLGSDTATGDVVSSDQINSRSRGSRTHEEIVLPGLVASSSAALAGSIAALLSTPVDNAKTRIMIADNTTSATQGTMQCMISIYRNEGFRALWRGGALRSAWTALGAGIYLGSYESGRLWWRSRNRSHGDVGYT
ncbi:unnamed protein product [Sympodiomycopsis kandeliae]